MFYIKPTNTIVNEQGITIKNTNHDYDFLVTIENDNDYAVELIIEDETSLIVNPGEWLGVLNEWEAIAIEEGRYELNTLI